MLFHVKLDVNLPLSMPEEKAKEIKEQEKQYSQQLQKEGKWRHLWRVSGLYSSISIFDVESNEELHEILQSLPLYPYMKVEVTALNRHPSSIRHDDK